MRKTLITCLIIYTITLGILLYNSLTQGIVSDRLDEYIEYKKIIDTGIWAATPDTIISSSLLAIYVPAQIQRITGWDAVVIFKIYPCFIYALVPLFSYLIARRYFNEGLSILCALFMLSQYNILHNSNIGRVSIGFGIFAIFAWAFINRRYLIIAVSGIILIMSHYGTLAIAMAIAAFTLICLIIQYRAKFREYIKLIIIGACVVLVIGVWYGIYNNDTWRHIRNFVSEVISPSSLSIPLASISDNGTIVYQSERDKVYELTLQHAFGLKWGEMNYYQKIEWFICWAIILVLVFGIVTSILKRIIKREHLYMTIACLLLLLVPIIVPWSSTHYGIVRVYITTLMIMSPLFIYGTYLISKRLNINVYILPSILIGLNILLVTGASPPYMCGLITI